MIKEALHAYVVENQRQFTHDRTKTIGASEIGQCARKLWFLKHQTDKDAGHVDRWGAAQRGNLIEVLWAKAMREHAGAGKLHYAGRYQKTFFDDVSPLSATPDGLLELDLPTGHEELLLECKSIDPRARMESIRSEHEAQVQVAMGILNCTTKWRPREAIVSYIDASFLDEVKEFRVPFDRQVFATLRLRAKTIMAANSADALRPEGVIAGGQECEHCAFRSSCSAMRAGAVPTREEPLEPLDEVALSRLSTMASDRARLKQLTEKLERETKEIEQTIKELLRQHGTRRVDAEGLRIVWSPLKGRPSWDWPKLRAAAEKVGLDLAKFERVGDPSDRLEVRLTEVAS